MFWVSRSDFSRFTTQMQLAPAACAHRNAAIPAGRPTVPVSCPNKPALLPLSMQSAGDPCPREVIEVYRHKQIKCTLNQFLEFGSGEKTLLSQYLVSQFSTCVKDPCRTHEILASFCFNGQENFYFLFLKLLLFTLLFHKQPLR